MDREQKIRARLLAYHIAQASYALFNVVIFSCVIAALYAAAFYGTKIEGFVVWLVLYGAMDYLSKDFHIWCIQEIQRIFDL